MVALSTAQAPIFRQRKAAASGSAGDLKRVRIAELVACRTIGAPLPLQVAQVFKLAVIPLALPAVSSGIVSIRTVLLAPDTTGLGPCDRVIQEPARLRVWRLNDRLWVGGAAQIGELEQTAVMLAPFYVAERNEGS